jgi:hypothetical protein
VLQAQRGAGNAAVSRWLSRPSRPVLQRAWLFCPDLNTEDRNRDVYFWDGAGPEPDSVPGVAKRLKLTKVTAKEAKGKFQWPEKQYLEFAGGSGTAKRSHYNPFGRFSDEVTKTAFLPMSEGISVPAELGQKGEHEPIAKGGVSPALTGGNIPTYVVTVSGLKLNPIAVIPPWGIVYGNAPAMDQSGMPEKASRPEQPTGVPPKIKLALDALGRGVEAQHIDASMLSGYTGTRKQSIGQKEIMGVSAGNVAAAAGYDQAIDPAFKGDTSKSGKKKRGWEWLHLVAYELGGPTDTGPQVGSNLVVGTTAANTSMMMVEDAIHDVIEKGLAKSADVTVLALLADDEYRVAETIRYKIAFTLKDGRTLVMDEFDFSALAVSTPFSAANRYFRHLMRQFLTQAAKEVHEPAPMEMF